MTNIFWNRKKDNSIFVVNFESERLNRIGLVFCDYRRRNWIFFAISISGIHWLHTICFFVLFLGFAFCELISWVKFNRKKKKKKNKIKIETKINFWSTNDIHPTRSSLNENEVNSKENWKRNKRRKVKRKNSSLVCAPGVSEGIHLKVSFLWYGFSNIRNHFLAMAHRNKSRSVFLFYHSLYSCVLHSTICICICGNSSNHIGNREK